jgi:hypothetical protein
MAGYTVRRDLYASKAASGITSEVYNVADANTIAIFLRGSPSTTTIEGSNANGYSTDITNTTTDWSALSTVVSPSPDMVKIATGMRYIRCLRSETTEVILHAQMLV